MSGDTMRNGFSSSDVDAGDLAPWWAVPIQRWVADGPPQALLAALPTGVPRPLPAFGSEVRCAQFALDPKCTFLNHGSYGAALRCTLEAQRTLTERCESQPIRFMEDEVLPMMSEAIRRVARFIKAEPSDVVFVPNATHGSDVSFDI